MTKKPETMDDVWGRGDVPVPGVTNWTRWDHFCMRVGMGIDNAIGAMSIIMFGAAAGFLILALCGVR